MLSIQKIRDIHYYDNLAEVDDYYSDARTERGRWHGLGATALGLAGDVASPDLRNLFGGFAPNGAALVQNAGRLRRDGRAAHSPGWDLTFSAPKSVSVAWALGSDATREAIETAHRRAVEITLRIAEEQCGFSRKGKGGRYVERCRLAIAAFQHGTSRELDPNLHTHCLVANVGYCHDAETRAIVSQQFYRWKMTLGKLYQTELSHQLRTAAHFLTAATTDAFEINGLPDELCKVFSKRRAQIEQSLLARGQVATARASETAALNTRKKKEALSPEVLRPAWREAAASLGVTPNDIDALGQALPASEPSFRLLDIYLDRAVEAITSSQAHFTKQTLLRSLGPTAIQEGMSATTLLAGVNRYLNISPHIIQLGELDLETQYTTTEVLARETELLDAAHKLSANSSFEIAQETIDETLTRHPGVAERPEQRQALDYLLEEGGLKLLAGMPGTGKTFVLDAARDAFETAGYRVLGTAIAGKAVRELATKAHVAADTTARLLADFHKTPLDEVAQHVRQLVRAAEHKPTRPLERYALDHNTVLLIDEAGMLDTPTAAGLIEAAQRCGAKVILIGDPDQLPPIGPGALFSTLLVRYPHEWLTDIKRQQDPADVAAIRALSTGDIETVLRNYQERGRLSIAVDKRQAIEKLVADWTEQGGAAAPQQHVVFVATNADRTAVNDACQSQRLAQSGGSSGPWLRIRSQEHRQGRAVILEEKFFVGDPVVCLKRSKVLGVENGTVGIVSAVDPRGRFLTMMVDEAGQKTEIVLPLASYPHVTRGYALSTHKGQGQTVEHSYVLLGGSMQAKELTYTQISRAKQVTMLYATVQDAGQDLAGLRSLIGRSRAKRMAHTMLPSPSTSEARRILEPPQPLRIPL